MFSDEAKLAMEALFSVVTVRAHCFFINKPGKLFVHGAPSLNGGFVTLH